MRAFLILIAMLMASPALAEISLVYGKPGPQDHDFIFRENKLEMTFSEAFDPKQAQISVHDEQDREVAAGILETSQVSKITVRMKAAVVMGFDAGAYVVQWRVVTPDGQITSGSYEFHVRRHH